ncbi:MAG: DUF3467 domain-containing protein [Elusimicrobiota bacterium]|jgi:hypothetical protein|nr:DUF3467 domain-containing protein [Elusimicrobiota bacterium]
MEEEKKEIKKDIKIEIDEQTGNGVYSNLAVISHTDGEFIFDFIFIQPQFGKAKVRSRIIASPAHAKRMLAALKDNIARYEAQFGEIKEAVIAPQETKTRYYN